MFGFTVCWGISEDWGVWFADTLFLGEVKNRSRVFLRFIARLVKIGVKLLEICDSVGIIQQIVIVCVKDW